MRWCAPESAKKALEPAKEMEMAFLSRLLEVTAMCAAARSSVSRHGPWRVFPRENTGLSQVVIQIAEKEQKITLN